MKSAGLALALVLALGAGAASAQSLDDRYGPAPYGDYSGRDDGGGYFRGSDDDAPGSTWRGGSDAQADDGRYDWARVVRVDPVFGGRSVPVHDTRRCQTRRESYAGGDPYRDGDRDDLRDGRDPYEDPYGQSRRDGNGRMVATVLGGIAGAVLGSKIGNGSGRYVGTAVGSMVGGMAGAGVYDANRRTRDRQVTVCDPEPVYDRGGRNQNTDGHDPLDRAVDAYDVTYEYAGREYVTRTDYHPGDRIRVRVDVRAE